MGWCCNVVAKPFPAMPASHMDAGSRYGCSTSNLVLFFKSILKGQWRMAQDLVPLNSCGTPKGSGREKGITRDVSPALGGKEQGTQLLTVTLPVSENGDGPLMLGVLLEWSFYRSDTFHLPSQGLFTDLSEQDSRPVRCVCPPQSIHRSRFFSIQLHLKHCTTYSFLYPLKKCSRSSIGSEDQVVIHVHLGVLFHPFSGVSHRGSPVQKMYFTFEPQTHRWFLRLGNPHQSKAFIKFGRPTPDQVTSTGPLSAPILAFLG